MHPTSSTSTTGKATQEDAGKRVDASTERHDGTGNEGNSGAVR